MNLDAIWKTALSQLESDGRLRALRQVARPSSGKIQVGGRLLVDFSSNDYLGLSRHQLLAERAAAFAHIWGTGAAASRLVSGNLEPFASLEERVAEAKGSEAALILSSGWQTNAGVLAAILDPRVLGAAPLVFSDKLNHASIHHGCRAAGARQIRYRHLDLDHLEALLRRHSGEAAPRFIVSETVFSMDGDRADVPALVALAERYGAFLYLDEAHATGVLGERGFGLAAGLGDRVGAVMGTFSKALGAFGGYVACSALLRAFLVNRCSSFIYSTALPPTSLGAIDAALELVPRLEEERRHLQELASWLRGRLGAAGLETGSSTTQIVPVILGSDQVALQVARALEEAGFLGVAIRPPTVPEGASRIRLSLSAAHTAQEVEALAEALLQAIEGLR